MRELPYPFLYLLEPEDYDPNAEERQRLEQAFRIFRRRPMENYELLNAIYQFAFSCGNLILDNINEHTLDEIVNGTASSTVKSMIMSNLYNERTGVVDIDNLLSGDIILTVFYDVPLFYCAGELFFVDKYGGFREADLDLEKQQSVFGTAVLRPAKVLRTFPLIKDAQKPKEELTPAQQAVVNTAKAYWYRNVYLRYADTRYMEDGEALGGEFRWSVKKNPPEACQRRNVGYTNCAAFVFDCYYFGLNFELPENMFTTQRMADLSAKHGIQVYLYERETGSVQSDEEQERVEEEFMAALEPADIMVIRREDGSGHALLYLGNGDMLHSTGQVYDYENAEERNLFTVQYGKVRNYFFNPELTPRGDVFTQATKLLILRPLKLFRGPVPEVSLRRASLDGIYIDSFMFVDDRFCCAHPGEYVRILTSFINYTDQPVTLALTHPPAEDAFQEDAKEPEPEITVDAKWSAQTWRYADVKEDVPMGTRFQTTWIEVNGVPFPTPEFWIGGRLHSQERDYFSRYQIHNQFRPDPLLNLDAMRHYYAWATQDLKLFPDADFAALTTGPEGLLKVYPAGREKTYYQLNPDSPYLPLLVPGLYGGRYVWSPEFEGKRAQRIDHFHVMAGDLILCRWKGQDEVNTYVCVEQVASEWFARLQAPRLYEFEGKKSAAQSLNALLAADFFLILRPALIRERSQQTQYDWHPRINSLTFRYWDV